jgi:hypothetical protein
MPVQDKINTHREEGTNHERKYDLHKFNLLTL